MVPGLIGDEELEKGKQQQRLDASAYTCSICFELLLDPVVGAHARWVARGHRAIESTKPAQRCSGPWRKVQVFVVGFRGTGSATSSSASAAVPARYLF